MPGLELQTVTQPVYPARAERGRLNSAPGLENPFEALMQEWADELTTRASSVDPLSNEPTASDADLPPADAIVPIAEAAATLTPINSIATLPIEIPVETESDHQPVLLSDKNPDLLDSPFASGTSPSGGALAIRLSSPTSKQETVPDTEAATIPNAFSQPSPSVSEPLVFPRGLSNSTVPDGGRVGDAGDVNQPNRIHTQVPLPAPSSEARLAPSHPAPSTTPTPEGDGMVDRPLSDDAEVAFASANGEAAGLSAAESRPNERQNADIAPATDRYADTTPTLARESQPVSSSPQPPDGRVSPASIPHVVVRMATDPEQKTQSFKIRLDPPRLGEISVDLRMSENGLSLRIVSQTPEARDLFQQDLPRLQELLKASGLDLQLFSASCDLGGERPQRQTSSPFERNPAGPFDTRSAAVSPSHFVRRQPNTSVQINAHA